MLERTYMVIHTLGNGQRSDLPAAPPPTRREDLPLRSVNVRQATTRLSLRGMVVWPSRSPMAGEFSLLMQGRTWVVTGFRILCM